MKEALLYQKLDEGMVRCALCAHRCTVKPGRRAICAVRENRDGVLYSLVYGRLIAANVDPIEKKPLFHFLPGSTAFSIATVGCNFHCLFCQNSDISQAPREGRWRAAEREVPPEQVVSLALRYRSRSIAYTYTEPTVFFEYARDVGVLARREGLKNIFVTNGYMTPEALEAMADWLDAANVDLKSGSDEFYRKVVGGRLAPVKESIRLMYKMHIWVEVTTLLIPDRNDDPEELAQIAAFLADLDPDIPWHISRFIPHYRMLDAHITPAETIHRAVKIGQEAGLRYVYAGNLPGDPHENTFCPSCKEQVIERIGYSTRVRLTKGKCSRCGQEIAGVMD